MTEPARAGERTGGPIAGLDRRDERALEAFVADVRERLGGELLSVALVGEAAGRGYVPRRTALSTAVVVRDVSPTALRALRTGTRRWRRKRIPTPLVLDPVYLESSRDVFPLEFLELTEQHRPLYGARDPLADLRVDLAHLRLEVEEQLRGKLLHLWAAYLEAGPSRRSLRRLLVDTPAGFEVILRGMLHLHTARGDASGSDRGGGAVDDPGARLVAVERAFGIELPVLRRLERVRHRGEPLARGEVEDVFEGYLREVRRLVRVVDGW